MDILRQIVASPRSRHPEAGLDLCYVTENIIVTSGPSATYPQIAYRNPLKDLVKFLDAKHGDKWAIWEFRAEGTGYPDAEVYGRIRHYPWPDHHPPPFAVVPLIMVSMREWLSKPEHVAVVHCKAGKGRSGTVSCSYLISEEGWTPEDAMERFTKRRMRAGFGAGVSIPSQVRYVGYVDRWTKHDKLFCEQSVEIVEVHIWGLRSGVKVAIEGYVDEGKVIENFHTFQTSERHILRGSLAKESGLVNAAIEVMSKMPTKQKTTEEQVAQAERTTDDSPSETGDVIFRPATAVVLPSNDINIDFERRNKSKYGGFAMVTSVAHVWFNTFFEGNGPEQHGKSDTSGVFAIDFDAMDGIKGSLRKGTRAFDRMSVVWKVVGTTSTTLQPPSNADQVPQFRPADWRGSDGRSNDFEKKLGLREATSNSAALSRASSYNETPNDDDGNGDDLAGVRSHGPQDEKLDV